MGFYLEMDIVGAVTPMGEDTEIVAPIPSMPQISVAMATPSQKCFGKDLSTEGNRGIAIPSGGVHDNDICFASM